MVALDIEIYRRKGSSGYIDGQIIDDWAQAKYLVHGFDDVLWTDDLDEAVAYLKTSIEHYEKDRDG